jgi:hypothetical protein
LASIISFGIGSSTSSERTPASTASVIAATNSSALTVRVRWLPVGRPDEAELVEQILVCRRAGLLAAEPGEVQRDRLEVVLLDRS